RRAWGGARLGLAAEIDARVAGPAGSIAGAGAADDRLFSPLHRALHRLGDAGLLRRCDTAHIGAGRSLAGLCHGRIGGIGGGVHLAVSCLGCPRFEQVSLPTRACDVGRARVLAPAARAAATSAASVTGRPTWARVAGRGLGVVAVVVVLALLLQPWWLAPRGGPTLEAG